ncbi:hypothetical protein EAS61_14040 [Bradyrhizobium zhanjiangense]|uniref:Uncharacterized protein n=1 Tax=Bradyrhizobium zhanjiangense TaxID=1325107 RepID=A0A4Q0QQH7_9BRAD|nr:hypothetical protein EAS61_14040 [Bradyrhizobium zhanjiangense]
MIFLPRNDRFWTILVPVMPLSQLASWLCGRIRPILKFARSDRAGALELSYSLGMLKRDAAPC